MNRLRAVRLRPSKTRAPHAAAYRPARRVLDNGATLLVCPTPQLAQCYVALHFGTGSRHESPSENGITHALEHMVFRGSKTYRNATQLNTAAEAIGGYLEGATYRDHVIFATGCHPSQVAPAIHILGELVTTPRYHAMEVEREILREELLEGVDEKGRSVDIDNIAHRQIFGTTGLGQCIEGSQKNLAAMTRDSLEAHRLRHMVGKNTVVCVAGPVHAKRCLDLLAKAFEILPEGDAPVDTPPPAAALEPRLSHVHDSASQVDLRLSFRGLPVQDPDYAALSMLGRVLADGLASRMHAELVDKQGLAYALGAGPTTYSDCGLFEFDVAVAPDKADAVMGAILDFAQSASRLRYTDEELARACRRHVYGLQFMGDSVADLTGWYGRAALFHVETPMERLSRDLSKVTPNDLRAVARRVFRREGLTLTAVGPIKRTVWRSLQARINDWQGHA